MKGFITGVTINDTFVNLHVVKAKASQEQATRGCEVATYRASREVAERIARATPGLFDLDLTSRNFGGKEYAAVEDAEFICGPVDLVFDGAGIYKRLQEPAAPKMANVAGAGK